MSDSQYMDHDQDFTLGGTFPLDQMKARPRPPHCLARMAWRAACAMLHTCHVACMCKYTRELAPV